MAVSWLSRGCIKDSISIHDSYETQDCVQDGGGGFMECNLFSELTDLRYFSYA